MSFIDMIQITSLNKSPDDLYRIGEDIGDKVEAWANKQMDKKGGWDKVSKEVRDRVYDAKDLDTSEIINVTEWTPSLKGETPVTWIFFSMAFKCKAGEAVCVTRAAIPILLDDEGVGTVFPVSPDVDYDTGEHDKDKIILLGFKSHFFNRYVERVHDGLWPKTKTDLLVKFLKRNPVFLREGMYNIYDKTLDCGKEVENVDVCFSGCIGRGHVVRGRKHMMFLLDTCISWQTLTNTQFRFLIPLMDGWKKAVEELYGINQNENEGNENENQNENEGLSPFEWKRGEPFFDYSKRQTIKEMHGELSFQSRKKVADHLGYDSLKVLDEVSCCLSMLQSMITQIAGRNLNDIFKAKVSNFKRMYVVAEQVLNAEAVFRSGDLNEIQFRTQVAMALQNIKVILELDIDDKLINEYIDRVPYNIHPEYYDEIKVNHTKDNVMNKKQITDCRAIINSKVKNWENDFNLGSTMKISPESYLSQVAPLFAIGRLSRIDGISDSHRKKYREADKLWVEKVVDNDWCNDLMPYVRKYGKELVTLSIHYLMDNDQWKCPIGIMALKPENYSCLELIDEAQMIVCDNNDCKPEPLADNTAMEDDAEIIEEKNTPDVPAPEFIINNDDIKFVSVKDAKSSMKAVLHNIDRLQAQMEQLEAFVNNQGECEDTKAKEDIQKLKVMLSDKEKAYESLKEKKNELADANSKLQKELNSKNAELNKERQAKEKIEATNSKNANIMKTQGEQLKALRAEYDEFKAKAKGGTITISLDTLKEKCTMIGKTGWNQVIDALKAEGIEVA